jgi:hypothetical protein
LFHGVANGRKRTCSIFSLETQEGEITNTSDLRVHIETYYKQLFGREDRGEISLQEDLWGEEQRLSPEEIESLIAQFTEKEIKEALDDFEQYITWSRWIHTIVCFDLLQDLGC